MLQKETKEALGTKYQETGTESILLEMSQKIDLEGKHWQVFTNMMRKEDV